MSASVLPSTTASTSSTMTTTTGSPSLDQSDAVTSLLSLGFAAAALPLAAPVQPPSSSLPQSTGGRHHRRLSSIGKTRRRLSDAKEASTRPLWVISSLFPLFQISHP
ncbi:hypothetical protein BJ165DRAFT_214994 [Panaeolus papilionaceus]|nr:hypothetical protein BJ165DRAFT_214994 [Panaeolus papilionaceus]